MDSGEWKSPQDHENPGTTFAPLYKVVKKTLHNTRLSQANDSCRVLRVVCLSAVSAPDLTLCCLLDKLLRN